MTIPTGRSHSYVNSIRVRYASLVDISLANGPGVNEGDFVSALIDSPYGSDVAAVVPRPLRGAPEPRARYRLTSPVRYRPAVWLKSQISFAIAVRAVNRHEPCDVLVVRLDLLPIGIAAAHLRSTVPLVVKTLGAGAEEALIERYGALGRLAGIAHRLLTGWLLRRAVLVDACTPELATWASRAYGIPRDQIVVIPNGARTERFHPLDRDLARQTCGIGDGMSPVIGFVGGRPWERGGGHVVRALPQLATEWPTVGAVIVGEPGKGSNSLPDLAERLGVGGRCVFPGVVDPDRVVDFVNCFDVGVSMDLPDRAAVVGNSSQKLRQYIACGVPVVAAAGFNHFVSEQGLGTLVDPGDLAAIVAALRAEVAVSGDERRTRRERAAIYARTHLSVEGLLTQRVGLWTEATKTIPRPVDSVSREKPTPIAYIAGYGRSGSSLLDALLDNVGDEVFGAGELVNLGVTDAEELCSCGEPLRKCEIWSKVLTMTDRWPRKSSGRLAHVDTARIVSESSTAELIIDSSKTTRGALLRPWLLSRKNRLQLIHLVRDPRAVVWSGQRGSNRQLKAEGFGSPIGSVRTTASWFIANVVAEAYGLVLGPDHYIRVRYEDLISYPGPTLRAVGRFLALDTELLVRGILENDSLSPGHGLAGNRARARPRLRLEADLEWLDRLPSRSASVATFIGLPLLVRYGYPVRRPRAGRRLTRDESNHTRNAIKK